MITFFSRGEMLPKISPRWTGRTGEVPEVIAEVRTPHHRSARMSTTTNDETWRPIPAFENYYEASDLGQIRAVERAITRVHWSGATYNRVYPDRVLAQGWSPREYRRVRLNRNGVAKTYLVHRLVLLAHRGVCPTGHVARHLDDDPENNTLSNLAWGLPEENIADRHRNGGYDFPRRTHCVKRGHILTPQTTYVSPQGQRKCRSCRAIRAIARKRDTA